MVHCDKSLYGTGKWLPNPDGRPANQPGSKKLFVFKLLREIDKAGKLEDQDSYTYNIIKRVRQEFPDSSFNKQHLNWYRWRYRKAKRQALNQRAANRNDKARKIP